MRELFQLACVALMFGKSEKEAVPNVPSPPLIIDAPLIIDVPPPYWKRKTVPLEAHPEQPAGFWPTVFSLIAMLLSLLPEGFLWTLVEFSICSLLLPPFARVMNRCLIGLRRKFLHRRVQDRTMSDVGTEAGPIMSDVGTQTGPIIGDEAALTKIKSNHAEEISRLYTTISKRSSSLRSERTQHAKQLDDLRAAMDPHGYYADESLERAANAQARDLRRLNDLIERKRSETKAALKKAEETTRLSKENRSLRSDLESMTLNVEDAKSTAFRREQQLREEVKQIKDYATTGTVSLDSYRGQIAQINRLTVAVGAAERQARDREEEGRIAVERLQGDLIRMQSLVQQLTSNQAAPDESSRAEGRLALERALEGQRTAERKLEEAEKNASESAAAVGQLEQSLQERLDALRVQLRDATSQASAQYQNGYLAGITQNPQANQGQEASTQTDHEENNGSGSGDEELRSEIEQLKAAKNEVEQKLDSQKSQAEEAVLEARRQAQEWVDNAKAQIRDEAATAYNQQWAAASANNEAELERVKGLGRQVENDRNAIAQQLVAAQQELANSQASCRTSSESEKTLQEQLRQVTESYESAMNRLENPEGSLKESNAVLDTVMARAEAAEEEVKKYKSGKAAQDGRIKDLHVENAALKRNARGELEAAENTANMNDKVRATALTDELVNRHYDQPSRIAATQLMKANARIMDLKLFLKKPYSRYSQLACLQILQHGEVDGAYKSLDPKMRVVLMKQCMGVNAKLMVLKAMINNGSRDPTRSELLQEIYNARGDELAVWNDEEDASSESSDEDEDDDDNAGEGSSAGATRVPFVPHPLPTSHRRPAPTTTAGNRETPLPTDPRPNNALKRKEIGDGNDNDNAGEGSSKRNDTSEMGMRPITAPTQGQSSHFYASNTRIPAPTSIIASLITKYADTTSGSSVPGNFAEGHTGFTFNVPRDIAQGILPHVRKYTRLSGTTNTVYSRRRQHLLPTTSNNDNNSSAP